MKTCCTKESHLSPDLTVFEALGLLEIQNRCLHFFNTTKKMFWPAHCTVFCNIRWPMCTAYVFISSNVSHQWLGFVSCSWYKFFLRRSITYILCKYDLLNCTLCMRGVEGIKKWWPWLPYKRLLGIKPSDSQYKKRNHELSRWNGKLMQGKGSFLLLFFCFLILCISRWVCGESPMESFSCLADPLWCCLSDDT